MGKILETVVVEVNATISVSSFLSASKVVNKNQNITLEFVRVETNVILHSLFNYKFCLFIYTPVNYSTF